ncbi:DUF305 domain-containing protein [Nocardia takedensis]
MTIDGVDPDPDTRPEAPTVEEASPARRVGFVALALTLSAGLILGIGIGWRLDRPPRAGHSTVDVGFAQDMSTHHAQAVEMSAVAMARTSDPEIRTLAYDVITTQQSQIGAMQGWLSLWGQSAAAVGPVMSWMAEETSAPAPPGHDMSAMTASDAAASESRMPGMASAQDLRALRLASGPTSDALYLQLLLRHHEGGLPMARYAAENATEPVVARLAASIEAAQSAEANTLRRLLEQRGVAPLPPS